MGRRPQSENPELDGTIKVLWDQGLTAGQVGEKLGVSRCTVLGRKRRMEGRGIVFSEHPRPPAKPKAPKKPRDPVVSLRWPIQKGPAAPQAAPLDPVSRPAGSYCTPETAGPGECRYGYGEPSSPDFRYCGRPAVKQFYCAFHYQICHTPMKAKA